LNVSANYNVIDTDYLTYTLVYQCAMNKDGKEKEEVAWILSRTRTLDQSLIDNLFTKIQSISPSLVKELKLTSQSECPQTNGVFH
jgi:hypothetical protein